jgi:hypothetical protein
VGLRRLGHAKPIKIIYLLLSVLVPTFLQRVGTEKLTLREAVPGLRGGDQQKRYFVMAITAPGDQRS